MTLRHLLIAIIQGIACHILPRETERFDSGALRCLDESTIPLTDLSRWKPRLLGNLGGIAVRGDGADPAPSGDVMCQVPSCFRDGGVTAKSQTGRSERFREGGISIDARLPPLLREMLPYSL